MPDDFEECHEGDEPREHEVSGPTKTDDLSIADSPVDSSESSSSPSLPNDGKSSDRSSIPSSDSSLRDYSSSSDLSDGAMTNASAETVTPAAIPRSQTAPSVPTERRPIVIVT